MKIPQAVKRCIPRRVKVSVRSAQFLSVYFGFLPPSTTSDTARDRVLDAVLAVRRDLKRHHCQAIPMPDADAFVGRLCRIYDEQRRHTPAPVYRIGKIWDAALRKWRRNYLTTLEAGNAAALAGILRCFHRNDAIAAMGIEVEVLREIFSKPFRSACLVTNLITKYQAFPRVCDPRFLRFIDEGEVGCPVGVPFDGQKLSPSGFRHAYYASEFSRATSLDQRDEFVVCELGGGYGNLARILKQVSGDRHLTYVIVDLPQMLPVSSFFLRSNFPHARLGLWDELRGSDLSRQELAKYDFVVLPNWDIERLPVEGVDAVINTASLAEMDAEIVANYLDQIRRITARSGYFYTVNRDRGIEYPDLDGARETGMNTWNLDWPGWRKIVDRPSWGDLHWGAWEQMDYKEVVLHRL